MTTQTNTDTYTYTHAHAHICMFFVLHFYSEGHKSEMKIWGNHKKMQKIISVSQPGITARVPKVISGCPEGYKILQQAQTVSTGE